MSRLWGILGVAIVIGCGLLAWNHTRSSATLATAQMVAACETAHHLQRQKDVMVTDSGTTIGSCDWPPPAWADRDGYSEILIHTTENPAGNEAAGNDQADYITIPCQTVQLRYDFGSQGTFEHRAPITAHAGDVLGEDPAASRDSRANLPGYPSRDEVVYLHNMKLLLASASCIGS
jgi:hypothetical protein